jgi:hypothetical protein
MVELGHTHGNADANRLRRGRHLLACLHFHAGSNSSKTSPGYRGLRATTPRRPRMAYTTIFTVLHGGQNTLQCFLPLCDGSIPSTSEPLLQDVYILAWMPVVLCKARVAIYANPIGDRGRRVRICGAMAQNPRGGLPSR